ncbi:endo-1,4-beta-xylanase [Clostridium acetobutylicum]|uniref:endo-1,4-beta-xylanase n=4 Tax=Clostridium acetobutylicum TaxID=1488 RepID=Q97TI5_CLOAB|nr:MULTISPECIES: endo-1,4-beta-xylanase [Clostridium]AAK76861.1 Xylanase, glycosyl hydrolase family 10 [Clostridium acetobutylicum ATCC 824]ADZ22898.1 Xylanase, glycosyl hydrolase family 10 [Clostridium acetobutylicum EA 2018]AEI34857.1 xylanase [Clostridium acetobutylicum DSM 1731]AWV82403.1 1,4-beta-xylanase [Clostridium acetobutylicum]MBC2395753.1 endo-1,4-beta-xylanase [Clostridium acetobutylicum]
MLKSKLAKICTGVLALGLALSISGVGTAKAAMSHSKFVGNIIAGNVPNNFSNYWNQVTPENATKWGAIEYSRGNYNWGSADLIYNYARSKNMPFKFHNLVWGSQQPNWMSNLSPQDQRSEVSKWIAAAGKRYSGSAFVDVVNEPLHTQPSYKNALGGSGSTGYDWIVWSYQQARKAFPHSKLLINEYGIIGDPNAAANYVKIINVLKSKGLIDGIGIQCHYFNMDNVSVGTMNSVLSTLSKTGLPIYVSELDMTGNDATQLARYQQKFPVLYQNPNVKGVTIWGYMQGQTWNSGTYLVNSNGTERPALKWLRSYLASH